METSARFSFVSLQPRRDRQFEAGKVERQVRIVSGIVQQFETPLVLHKSGFAHEMSLLLLRRLMSAGGGLGVDQVSERRPDVEVARRDQTQTEIDVIETDREIRFVERPDFFEKFLLHSQAGAGYGRDVLLHQRAAEITTPTALEMGKSVTGNAAETKNHAPCLQGAVGIPETGADRADFEACRMAD